MWVFHENLNCKTGNGIYLELELFWIIEKCPWEDKKYNEDAIARKRLEFEEIILIAENIIKIFFFGFGILKIKV